MELLTELEQLIEVFTERKDLKIAYWKYIKTKQRIATMEEQLRTRDLL